MKHLLECARIVPSFDDLKRNTVTDLEHGGTHLSRQGLIFL